MPFTKKKIAYAHATTINIVITGLYFYTCGLTQSDAVVILQRQSELTINKSEFQNNKSQLKL